MAKAILDPVLNRVAAVGSAMIDPKRLASTLHATVAEVAELAGVHRSSLTRNPASPEVQRKLGDIATVLSRATEMSGSLEKAIVWFRHQPIPALGHARAADLVAQGRAGTVLKYFDVLEHGAYA